MPVTERDLDDLLTIEHVAEILQVSRSTVSRMIAARELDVIRVGTGRGRPRITKRSLLDQLNRHVIAAERPRRTRTA